DGSKWTVNEDWEVASGIVQDLFSVETSSHISNTETPTNIISLQHKFTKEPLFLDVIEALYNLDSSKPVKTKRGAQHHAKQYFIENDKLWMVVNDSSTRVHSKLECITQEEAVELVRSEHANNGHWGRDMVKLQLMDRIYSPCLDHLVTTAI
ncbi:hypothetical protein BDR06DRAFT_836731, partial [Suillus hirtellus]